MQRRNDATLELLVSSFGLLGLFAGFPIMPAAIVQMVALFALASVGLHVIASLRFGKTLARALLEIVLVGGLSCGGAYGCIWYFTVHLASRPNLWHLGQ